MSTRVLHAILESEGVAKMAANIVVDGPKQVDIPKHKVESIGTVAGFVWQFLNNSSPMTLSKLAREIDAPGTW